MRAVQVQGLGRGSHDICRPERCGFQVTDYVGLRVQTVQKRQRAFRQTTTWRPE